MSSSVSSGVVGDCLCAPTGCSVRCKKCLKSMSANRESRAKAKAKAKTQSPTLLMLTVNQSWWSARMACPFPFHHPAFGVST